jgi:group I intron endonuclease
MGKILYIYKITNIINGKIYVGKHSAKNIENSYMGSGIAIRRAIKKYRLDNFRKEILCICENEKKLNEMEIFWIAKTGSFNDGYNMTKGGEGALGYKPTEDVIKRAAESRARYYEENQSAREILSEKARERIGEKNPFWGKRLSQAHIKKMTQARIRAITGRNNPSAVRVKCIEKDIVFDTAKEAAEYCGLKYSTTILKAAKGQLKTAGGYKWELV